MREAGHAFRVRVPQEKALATLTGSGFDKFEIQLEDRSGDPGDATLVVTPKPSSSLTAILPPEIAKLCRAKLVATKAAGKGPRETAVIAEEMEKFAFAPRPVTSGRDAAPADPSFVTLVFRSPDEIVYFLGELLREKLRCQHTAAQAVGEHARSCLPQANYVFDIERNANGPVEVVVEHHGARWSIPANSNDRPGSGSGARTMEVIALLNALIASQTSASEFSRTPSIVRIR
jgi:hypothetical protein